MSAWLEPLEWVKVGGGIAGLISLSLAIWDRFYRSRPTCSLLAAIDKDGDFIEFHVKVRNATMRDIEITNISCISNADITVSPSPDMRSSKEYFDNDIHAIIPASTDRSFYINFDDSKLKSEIDEPIIFKINWKNTDREKIKGLGIFLKSSLFDLRKKHEDAVRRARADGRKYVDWSFD